MPVRLPTTPGSVLTTEDGHRFALSLLYAGAETWICLTRWRRRQLSTDELLDLNPTVEFTAPEFAPWLTPEFPGSDEA